MLLLRPIVLLLRTIVLLLRTIAPLLRAIAPLLQVVTTLLRAVTTLNSICQVVRVVSLPGAALAQGTPLDVAGLAAGVYTLRLLPVKGPVVVRLVRQ